MLTNRRVMGRMRRNAYAWKKSKQPVLENQVFLGLNCTLGHRSTGYWNRANAWGEKHLWLRYRKVSDLSGGAIVNHKPKHKTFQSY